jgi:hypothetical protein
MGVLIDIILFRVRSLDIDKNELSWQVGPTSEDILDYTFAVRRSESPNGPWDVLTPPFQDEYVFIDKTTQVGDRWRKLFYQIAVTHIPSGETKCFGPVAQEPEADLVAQELRRHMQLLFKEFAGRRCWVLPVRTFGQRCSCWNAKLKMRQRSGCKICWDTSWVRGYMHPIESWIQVDPSPKAKQFTNVGEQEQSNTTMRLVWYPPLKPDDLIIEPENRRWKVVQVNQTEQGRAAVHQEVQIHEVPPKDIEYAIPLVLDRALKDIWFNPERNYTNPFTLGDFLDTEMPDIMQVYSVGIRRRP